MSDYATNIDQISSSQASKEIIVNANFNAASPSLAFGRRDQTTAALTWGYYGGNFRVAGALTWIPNGTLTLTDNATCYIKITSAGVVNFTTSAPSGWPDLSGDVALYEVTTLGGATTNWIDKRALSGPGATGAPGSDSFVVNGRLTLTSGMPVTISDVIGATNIYFTPYDGNYINLWDGAAWTTITFTEYTLALGTLTSAKPYDVFAYNNSGALALEMLVWTNTTTRATAVTLQDGRYCKSGDKTRLYVGTFYTTATTTTEDSVTKRFVWNMYNRRPRFLDKSAGSSSHTYASSTYQEYNASTTLTRVQWVLGIEDCALVITGTANVQSGVANNGTRIAIGVNSTTAAAQEMVWYQTANSYIPFNLSTVITTIGLNYATLIEKTDAGTGTFNFGALRGSVS